MDLKLKSNTESINNSYGMDENFREKYDMMINTEENGIVGEGGTAVVKLVKSKNTKEKLAIKIINKHQEIKKLNEKNM